MSPDDNRHDSFIIELIVHNHPGVMSHITGLFARRAFNLEGILCGPMPGGELSGMYLLVNERPRLEQVIRQLEKLHDVVAVKEGADFDRAQFHMFLDRAADGFQKPRDEQA